MKPTIRLPAEADLSVLVEIERASFTHPHWSAPSFLRYQCRVADIGGTAVGFVIWREVFPGDSKALPEREIMNLAVTPTHRRLGIASILLRTVLEQPADYYLEVRESNLPAQSLYRRFGFAPIAIRQGYYEHPTESAIVMRLKWC